MSRRFSLKAQVRRLLRSSPPSQPLNTLTRTSRLTMADTVVPIQAKWFSLSNQWEYAPQPPYDVKNLHPTEPPPTSISLITWNVDFANRHVNRRLTAALDYLQYNAFQEFNGGQPPPCLILLQEVAIEAFDALLAHPWVQAYFMVVPGVPE